MDNDIRFCHTYNHNYHIFNSNVRQNLWGKLFYQVYVQKSPICNQYMYFLLGFNDISNFSCDIQFYQMKCGGHHLKETNELSSWSLAWASLIWFAGVLMLFFHLSIFSFQIGTIIQMNYDNMLLWCIIFKCRKRKAIDYQYFIFSVSLDLWCRWYLLLRSRSQL